MTNDSRSGSAIGEWKSIPRLPHPFLGNTLYPILGCLKPEVPRNWPPMDASLYKLLHLLGVALLLSGLGSLLTQPNKVGAALHGSGLAILLVSGFGMAAKLGYGFPWWILVKVLIWLVLGGMITVAKKRLLPPAVAWTTVLVLSATAVFLGWRFGIAPM